jgi:hypothetical protein
MGSHLERALTRLPKDAVLHLDAGAGEAVVVFHGRVWITQDGDARDVVLGPGESFTLDRPGVALAQALRDSSLLVVARPDAGSGGEALAGARRLASLPDFLRQRWTLGRPQARGTADFD